MRDARAGEPAMPITSETPFPRLGFGTCREAVEDALGRAEPGGRAAVSDEGNEAPPRAFDPP